MSILCYLYTKIKTFSYFLLNDVKTSSTAAFLLPVSSWNYIKYTYFCLFFQNKSWFTKTHIEVALCICTFIVEGGGGVVWHHRGPPGQDTEGGQDWTTAPTMWPDGTHWGFNLPAAHLSGSSWFLLFYSVFNVKTTDSHVKAMDAPPQTKTGICKLPPAPSSSSSFCSSQHFDTNKDIFFFKLIRVNVRSLHLWLHSNTTFIFLFFFLKTPCSDLNVS